MKTKILLVGHGSRDKEGNRQIEAFANIWREKNPQWHIDICFIEFADVLLDKGLDNAAQNAQRVIVVPLILNAAGHVKMEIPHFINEARQRNPQVEYIYARHLGANESILKILQRNLRKVLLAIDAPDPKNTGVILLGRGSSDRVANGEIAKMSRWLFEGSGHQLVDVAFTGITDPRIEVMVQRQVQQGMTQIAILPYYLFTGTLIQRINRQVERLQKQYPTIVFSLGTYFGFEEEIYTLLNERVNECLGEEITGMMECDGCLYRQEAEAEHHHHHHEPEDSHHHEHDHDHAEKSEELPA